MEHVDNIGSILLKRKILRETPTLISTDYLSMFLSRQRSSDLNNSRIEDGNVSIVFPAAEDLLQGSNDNLTVVDSQVGCLLRNILTISQTQHI